MEKDTGGSAFPLPLGTENMSEPTESGGMSLRDYFAAKAMQGMASKEGAPYYEYEATVAYKYADAMLKARNA